MLYFGPMNTLSALRKCPIFSSISDSDLDLLLKIGRVREYPKGELLFADGDKALGFYVVLSGKVKIYKLSPEGKERILHIIYPVATFAEAAIFGSGLYPAYAEPLEKSQLFFLPKDAFLQTLRSNSELALGMIGGLSAYLRLFARQIEDMTFKDVPARLARFLIDHADGDRVSLAVSKTQLASHLGTVSETLSRTFRKLSDEGLISVSGKSIQILDFDTLEELAETCKE